MQPRFGSLLFGLKMVLEMLAFIVVQIILDVVAVIGAQVVTARDPYLDLVGFNILINDLFDLFRFTVYNRWCGLPHIVRDRF